MITPRIIAKSTSGAKNRSNHPRPIKSLANGFKTICISLDLLRLRRSANVEAGDSLSGRTGVEAFCGVVVST